MEQEAAASAPPPAPLSLRLDYPKPLCVATKKNPKVFRYSVGLFWILDVGLFFDVSILMFRFYDVSMLDYFFDVGLFCWIFCWIFCWVWQKYMRAH